MKNQISEGQRCLEDPVLPVTALAITDELCSLLPRNCKWQRVTDCYLSFYTNPELQCDWEPTHLHQCDDTRAETFSLDKVQNMVTSRQLT